MLTVNLFDSNFGPQACSVAGKTPELVQYVRGQMRWDGITIFTDAQMLSPDVDECDSRVKLGWLHEGRCLREEVYEASKRVRHKFDAILTYDAGLIVYDPEKYIFVPRAGVWTPKHQWGIYPKTKQVSMILSEKTQCPGHRLRHEIAASVSGIDLYGPQHTPIGTDKRAALADYRYSIIVEACREPNLFTEHLLDCLAFGTVPIYWGCPNIGHFFNAAGIIEVETLVDVERAVQRLQTTPHQFLGGRWTVKSFNLERLREYEITDDWIARHVLPRFAEVTA